MSRVGSFIVAPRDGFFAKDGRGWFTSASGRARSLPWPWPTTIRGALRGAWGRQVEAARGRPLDAQGWVDETEGVELGASLPVLGEAGAWTAADRMWPVPADAFFARATSDEGAPQIHRLRPRPPSGAVTLRRFGADVPPGLWSPAVPAEKPASRPAWWTDAEFAAWCRGEAVRAPDAAAREARAPSRRTEIRLRIDPRSGTAADGLLFSTELTEALAADGRAWAVAARVGQPEAAGIGLDGALTYLGGKRRLARVEGAGAGVFDAPADDAGDAPGMRLYVVTPACFADGWLPNGFSRVDGALRGRLAPSTGEFVLRAAIVGRPVAVGGWDMQRRRPKPIRRLVPAGSVYFFQRPDGAPISAAERRALWLAAAPQSSTDVADGLGRVVAAPWYPNRTAPEAP